jgi:SNF2 family DNA or RNA helicase
LTQEKSKAYRVVDDELIERLRSDETERKNWLFLEESSQFKGKWVVDAFTQAFFFDMRDLIGAHKTISPAKLEEFLDLADNLGYDVAFLEDPLNILGPYEALNEPPEITINSQMPNTVNGMLPFQVRGFNHLKKVEGGVALWSTGTGKTVLASALIKYAIAASINPPTLVLHVAKAHNKVNVQRALKRLVDLDAVVVSGDKKRRRNTYREALVDASVFSNEGLVGENLSGVHGRGEVENFRHCPILVLNYEKFRTDTEEIRALCQDQNVVIIWDEMPARLKTRTSQVYKSVVECLYTTPPPAVDYLKRRPQKLRQWMLSATPIENNPEDFFNCVRILDPRVYGTVAQFRDEYVASYSFFNEHKPDKWHKLDKMGLQAEHILHQADKQNDPEIAAQFPETIPETIYIDWDEKDRKIYDILTKQIEKLGIEDANVLSLIGVMQMLCDAPSLVVNSSARREVFEAQHDAWKDAGADPATEPSPIGSEIADVLVKALGKHNLTDERHTKLATLRELLCKTHPDEKVLVFTALNESIMPMMEAKLNEWGVTYVRYAGTDKQKQAAEDAFMTDPDIQVFLSSDMGSDSLNLQAGSVVIHYDLPWKWSTYSQRENRVHRVDSEFESVRYYTLLMENSVEDRKIDIIQRKLGYHDQIFNGEIAEKAITASMSKEDLYYVLTGHSRYPE